jgi:hypothetical protein
LKRAFIIGTVASQPIVFLGLVPRIHPGTCPGQAFQSFTVIEKDRKVSLQHSLNRKIMSKYLTFCFAAFAVLMVGLAVIGGLVNFSSVPFWDMWDGTLQFYSQAQSGDWSAWWSQHNEHRIILARLLFWLDLHCFGGRSIFLVVMNYFFLACIAYVFWLFVLSTLPQRENMKKPFAFGFFLLSWIFLWVQHENLTWAFQAQFFLAQLLPLLALYLFAKSISDKSVLPFVLAVFLGIASAGTMANGVLVLPLMFLYSFVIRQPKKTSLLLLLISALTIALYFYGDAGKIGQHSLLLQFVEHPFGIILYVLLYLGGPFFFLAREGVPGAAADALIAAVFIVFSILTFVNEYRKKNRSPYVFALLTFVAYIILTALITAGGRLQYGVAQAFASRYTTPALMAYAALFVILRPCYARITNKMIRRFTSLLFFALCLLMLAEQIKALKYHKHIVEDRKIAALALSLGVKDEAEIINIFPDASFAMDIANQAIEGDYSVFSYYPYHGLRETIGKKVGEIPKQACAGHLLSVTPISEGDGYYRVQGWVTDPRSDIVPRRIQFIQNNRSVGYALTGISRSDRKKITHKRIKSSGFSGYAKLEKGSSALIAIADHSSCKISFNPSKTSS